MAYFESDLHFNEHISAIFTVLVDFGFVAGFSGFTLKVRNFNFFIMVYALWICKE